jgi:ABC-type transport system substrate-binding protein
MNIKSILPKLAIVATLMLIFTVTLAAAQPYVWSGPGSGAHVDEHWFSIIISDEEALNALLTGDTDLGGPPQDEDIDTLLAAGFTMTSTTRLGYTFVMENNRVWPLGGVAADGVPEAMSTNFRKGLHRLVNKPECVALYAPLMSGCEWWLPPGQAYWINPATPSPTFDPMTAVAYMDAGGFVEGTTPNPFYTGADPWEAEYLRVDPVMGGDVFFEYYAIGPTESPTGFEMAQLITSYWRRAGVTVDLVAGTWLGMVIRLVNDDLLDYQVMTGVGIVWGSPAPDILYDFTYHQNLPLWNFCSMNISEVNAAGEALMSTLVLSECRQAAYDIQTVLSDYEPYYPMLLWNMFVAERGPSRTEYPLGAITWDPSDPLADGTWPGMIRVVNFEGRGAATSGNVWGKMHSSALRFDPGRPDVEINLWNQGAYLDTLNPYTADTVPDWQVLQNILDGSYGRNPYTLDYLWWSCFDQADQFLWVGPGRTTGPEGGVGNGVYDAPFTGTHYDGIPIADVTADDLVGDDQLGVCYQWEMRDTAYWHDSDPGDDGIIGTGDDGVLHPVTTADWEFNLNLLRDQNNVRYVSSWNYIYGCYAEDADTIYICEERRFLFAFESEDLTMLPKHLMETWVGPTYTALPITLPDGSVVNGEMMTDWDEHHEDWYGWEEAYMPDPMYRDPGGGVAPDAPMLTYLIGFGPFKYHLGGWEPGVSAHFEANRQYFAHGTCIGDIDFSLTCELPDWYATMASFGAYRVDANYDIKADIKYPAQVVDLDEVYAVQFEHFGHYHGPQPVPFGFVYCDHST